MTMLHSGGKFSGKAYATSGGLHGVGISVVNALSSDMSVEVARNRELFRQTFSRGHKTSGLEKLGAVPNRRGTTIRFLPDTEIFGAEARFRASRLYKLARSKAYLFGGVEIRWKAAPALLDGDTPETAVFQFPGGLADHLKERAGGPRAGDAGTVRRPRRPRRWQGCRRMGLRLAALWRRLGELLLQHHPDARWRHARGRACAWR